MLNSIGEGDPPVQQLLRGIYLQGNKQFHTIHQKTYLHLCSYRFPSSSALDSIYKKFLYQVKTGAYVIVKIGRHHPLKIEYIGFTRGVPDIL
jgi:hypothetical protein